MTSTAALMIIGILAVILAGAISVIGGPGFLIGWFTGLYLITLAAVTYYDSKR